MILSHFYNYGKRLKSQIIKVFGSKKTKGPIHNGARRSKGQYRMDQEDQRADTEWSKKIKGPIQNGQVI
jgi:hypothetical protein